MSLEFIHVFGSVRSRIEDASVMGSTSFPRSLRNSVILSHASCQVQRTIHHRLLPWNQHGAACGLEIISWPPKETLPQPRRYVYANDGHNEPTIYIIHTGLDPTSPVTSSNSCSAQESTPWNLGMEMRLFSPTATAESKTCKTDDNPNSHDFCVAPKAVGSDYGVHKRSNPVVVRTPGSLPPWRRDSVLVSYSQTSDTTTITNPL